MLTELTSCLQLVAPVGMGEDEQDTWFEAALKALSGIPLGLLQRGASAARLRADHPAKIIPAIVAEIGEAWAWRKQYRGARAEPAPHTALPAPGQERATADEVDAICKRLAVGRYAQVQPARSFEERAPQPASADPDRACRSPTRADYLRLGVAPEVLDRLAAPADDDGERREAA